MLFSMSNSSVLVVVSNEEGTGPFLKGDGDGATAEQVSVAQKPLSDCFLCESVGTSLRGAVVATVDFWCTRLPRGPAVL